MKQQSFSRGRPIDGILLLDKPIGITSNAALQSIKRLFGARKAGHTGSLDPLASGMLPICFGETTKFSQYLLDADKHYQVTAKLGICTTTGDAEGDIITQRDPGHITEQALAEVLANFRGEVDQVPSMYSALKYQGQPLYKLARQGITVEREPRKVKIYELILQGRTQDALTLKVHCSKGTYVRTLVEDIGQALNCGAHVTALRRFGVGHYNAARMISPDALVQMRESGGHAELDTQLLSIETLVEQWSDVRLSKTTAHYVRRGQAVWVPHAPTQGWVKLSDEEGKFLGIGEILSDGKIAPRRLINRNTIK